jgi:hypothetical protein
MGIFNELPYQPLPDVLDVLKLEDLATPATAKVTR